MRQSTRVILNSTFSFGQQAVDLALQVFLLAFILRRIDSDAYGMFLLAVGIQGMMYLVRDAISKGCVRYLAQYREQGRKEMLGEVVSTASAFLLLPASVTMLAVVLGAEAIAGFLEVRPALYTSALWVIRLAGLNVLLVLPLFPFRSLIESHQRYDIIAAVTVCFRLLRAAMIVALFVLCGPNVLYVMIGTVVADVGTQLGMFFMARRLEPTLRVRPGLCDRKTLKGLLSFGSFLVFSSFVLMGTNEATKWIVGKLLSLEFVTFLMITIYAAHLLRMLTQTMTLVLVPVASRYKAQENEAALGEMLVRGTRYASLVSMAGMSVLAPVMAPLLSLWLKPEMAKIAPFAVAVGICGAISVPSNCAEQILNGMGDSKRPFLANLASGLSAILVTITALTVLGWGFSGAVAGTCVGLLVLWLGRTFFALRTIRAERRRFAWEGYVQPLLAALPAVAVGIALNRHIAPDSWLKLLAVAFPSFAVYIVAFLPHVKPPEWQMVAAALGKLRTVISGRRIT